MQPILSTMPATAVTELSVVTRMSRQLGNVWQHIARGLAICALVVSVFGCGNRFWDPPQIGRFESRPVVNVILDSLGVAEEAPLPWDAAEEPMPTDIVPQRSDYVLAPGDLVRISILELYAENQVFTAEYVISETGRISIPEVGIIEAAGLTETDLEAKIKQVLSPGILRNPSVSVALVGSQQRTFSVIGDGVDSPGRYVIPRYDFRLTDALAMAKGPRQFNVSNVYIGRPIRPPSARKQSTLGPTEQQTQTVTSSSLARPVPAWANNSINAERALLGMIPIQTGQSARASVWPSAELISAASFGLPGGANQDKMTKTPTAQPRIDWIFQNGRWVPVARLESDTTTSQGPGLQGSGLPTYPDYTGQDLATGQGPAEGQPGRIEWVFKDGKWVPVQVPTVQPPAGEGLDVSRLPAPEAYPKVDSGIEWVFKDGKWVPIQRQPVVRPRIPEQIGPEQVVPLEAPPELTWEAAARTRLIRVPTDKLLAGDPRYNLVVQPGDTIYVPVDIVGEACIMGNVNKAGYINLTGRPMTLKMAIAAAGGLGPLAYPKRCEVIRRIGNRREEIVLVDLDKIARGEQPDFFIKPNDLINVGTHYSSRWRAVLRNAFRAVYGFGFVYDRNFADSDYGWRR